MSQPAPSSRLWKIGRWLLFAGIALITVIILIYSLISYQGRRDWARFQKELAAKGEKLSLVEIVPPPVPDELNFFAAPVWQEVVEAKPPPGTKQASEGFPGISAAIKGKNGAPLPIGGMEKFTPREMTLIAEGFQPDRPVANETEAAEVVLQFLTVADAELAAIHRAAERPEARFPIDYEKGFASLMPHISPLMKMAKLLDLRIAAEAQVGKGDAALTDLFLMFYLADSIAQEPMLISQLVRLSILQQAVNAIWEGLQRNAWNDAQLQAIQSRIAGIHLEESFRLTLRGERGLLNQTVEPLVRNMRLGELMKRMLAEGGVSGESIGSVGLIWVYPKGWVLSDLAFYNSVIQRLIDHGSSWEQAGYWKQSLEPEVRENARFPKSLAHIASTMAMPAWDGAIRQFQKGETRLREAQIACALERYRLANGRFPERLDALVPQFLNRVPLDVCGGRVFRYRAPAPDEFVLWSVGPDQVDNHAQPVLKNADPAGDWVWKKVPRAEDARARSGQLN